jgi:hypothetical protein
VANTKRTLIVWWKPGCPDCERVNRQLDDLKGIVEDMQKTEVTRIRVDDPENPDQVFKTFSPNGKYPLVLLVAEDGGVVSEEPDEIGVYCMLGISAPRPVY